jgi:chromosome segregation protein
MELSDRGAHFKCCDLHVHTPRDRDWEGDCPVTDAERVAYAGAFIAACRDKKLDAVGITDHHDVAFFPYIKAASESELDANGQPVPPEQQIVVFPGMELTLALPCQALILFDPDVSQQELRTAQTILRIVPSPSHEAKTAPTRRLDADLTLQRVTDELSVMQHNLRGRFILFPNVNAGGEDTILRHNFQQHYKDMPCVGGYVDGSCADHGRHLILEGQDPNWGNKRIGVFQTSDSRCRDFANVGLYPTWVKWSRPTTEALRQACLAPSSRIRYSAPRLPDNWVRSLEVTDSRYFGPFKVEFNPEANMIIGGRGSGKSTILEYLRWGLCDQPGAHLEEGAEEVPDYDRRRRSLVKATLQYPSIAAGNVKIEFFKNGVLHKVRREAATGKVFLSVASRQEQETTEEAVQSFAKLQDYSQKQLSNVSVRHSELLRLLTAPIGSQLALLDKQLQEYSDKLRIAFQNDESRRTLDAQVRAIELELSSQVAQQKQLQEGVKDLPQDQKTVIESHSLFSEGTRLMKEYSGVLSDIEAALNTAKAGIEKNLGTLQEVGEAEPTALIQEYRERLRVGLSEIELRVTETLTN